jgi:hypothetical protein
MPIIESGQGSAGSEDSGQSTEVEVTSGVVTETYSEPLQGGSCGVRHDAKILPEVENLAAF